MKCRAPTRNTTSRGRIASSVPGRFEQFVGKRARAGRHVLVVEHADPAPAEGDEVCDGGVDPGLAVHRDRTEARARALASDVDHGDAARVPGNDVGGRAQVPDDRVDLRADHLERAELLLAVARGVVDHHVPAAPPGLLQRGRGDLGEERVHEVRDDQPDGRRVLPDQRNGLVRDPRRTGDVADRHPLAGHRSSSTREVTLAADAGRDPPRDATGRRKDARTETP
jgi:hypothetical protein